MPRANVIPTDPAWEAAKAARRNFAHDDAVQLVSYLQQQYRSQWSDAMSASPVDLNEIIRTLTTKRVPFVLTGAHGISGWMGRPRGTQDVDILVKGGRNFGRAVRAIRALYPQLEERAFPGITAFFVQGEKDSVIDVVYPHRADLEETLARPVWTVNKEQGLRYRVPALESALANKYGAMITPNRPAGKRLIDAADFTWMVTHSCDKGRRPIDLERLEALGEKVWRGGGGREVLRLVELVKAGRTIQFDSLGK